MGNFNSLSVGQKVQWNNPNAGNSLFPEKSGEYEVMNILGADSTNGFCHLQLENSTGDKVTALRKEIN